MVNVHVMLDFGHRKIVAAKNSVSKIVTCMWIFLATKLAFSKVTKKHNLASLFRGYFEPWSS